MGYIEYQKNGGSIGAGSESNAISFFFFQAKWIKYLKHGWKPVSNICASQAVHEPPHKRRIILEPYFRHNFRSPSSVVQVVVSPYIFYFLFFYKDSGYRNVEWMLGYLDISTFLISLLWKWHHLRPLLFCKLLPATDSGQMHTEMMLDSPVDLLQAWRHTQTLFQKVLLGSCVLCPHASWQGSRSFVCLQYNNNRRLVLRSFGAL